MKVKAQQRVQANNNVNSVNRPQQPVHTPKPQNIPADPKVIKNIKNLKTPGVTNPTANTPAKPLVKAENGKIPAKPKALDDAVNLTKSLVKDSVAATQKTLNQVGEKVSAAGKDLSKRLPAVAKDNSKNSGGNSDNVLPNKATLDKQIKEVNGKPLDAKGVDLNNLTKNSKTDFSGVLKEGEANKLRETVKQSGNTNNNFLNSVGNGLNNFAKGVGNNVDNLKKGVENNINSAANTVGNNVNNFTKGVGDNINAAKNKVGEELKYFGKGVSETAKETGNQLNAVKDRALEEGKHLANALDATVKEAHQFSKENANSDNLFIRGVSQFNLGVSNVASEGNKLFKENAKFYEGLQKSDNVVARTLGHVGGTLNDVGRSTATLVTVADPNLTAKERVSQGGEALFNLAGGKLVGLAGKGLQVTGKVGAKVVSPLANTLAKTPLGREVAERGTQLFTKVASSKLSQNTAGKINNILGKTDDILNKNITPKRLQQAEENLRSRLTDASNLKLPSARPKTPNQKALDNVTQQITQRETVDSQFQRLARNASAEPPLKEFNDEKFFKDLLRDKYGYTDEQLRELPVGSLDVKARKVQVSTDDLLEKYNIPRTDIADAPSSIVNQLGGGKSGNAQRLSAAERRDDVFETSKSLIESHTSKDTITLKEFSQNLYKKLNPSATDKAKSDIYRIYRDSLIDSTLGKTFYRASDNQVIDNSVVRQLKQHVADLVKDNRAVELRSQIRFVNQNYGPSLADELTNTSAKFVDGLNDTSRKHLDYHELLGGHTKEVHVGRSANALRKRLATDPTLKSENFASSFRNEETANRALGILIGKHKADIDRFVNAKSGGKLEIIFDIGETAGNGVSRDSAKEWSSSRVYALIARNKSKEGWHVVTAYPKFPG